MNGKHWVVKDIEESVRGLICGMYDWWFEVLAAVAMGVFCYEGHVAGWKLTDVSKERVSFGVISRHFLAETGKNHEEQPGWPFFLPIFEPKTSWIRRITHSIMAFAINLLLWAVNLLHHYWFLTCDHPNYIQNICKTKLTRAPFKEFQFPSVRKRTMPTDLPPIVVEANAVRRISHD